MREKEYKGGDRREEAEETEKNERTKTREKKRERKEEGMSNQNVYWKKMIMLTEKK